MSMVVKLIFKKMCYFIEITPPVLVNINLRLKNNNDQADKHILQNLTL